MLRSITTPSPWGPAEKQRSVFRGERRRSGTSKFCRLRRNEGCGTCADEVARSEAERAGQEAGTVQETQRKAAEIPVEWPKAAPVRQERSALIGVPTENQRSVFRGERRRSGTREFCRLRRNEGCGTCVDEDRPRPVCLRPKRRRCAAVGLRSTPAGVVFSARRKENGGWIPVPSGEGKKKRNPFPSGGGKLENALSTG